MDAIAKKNDKNNCKRNCFKCKRCRDIPNPSSKPGPLPKVQTEQCYPFKVIRVDYAGPIYYRSKNKTELKSYILLLWCSVSRVVHTKLVTDRTTQMFIKCLKKLVERCGGLKMIYSGNAKKFEAVAKWLLGSMKRTGYTVSFATKRSFGKLIYRQRHPSQQFNVGSTLFQCCGSMLK